METGSVLLEWNSATMDASLGRPEPRLLATGLIVEQLCVLVFSIENQDGSGHQPSQGQQRGDRAVAEPNVIMPTEEEDARINRGIAQDPDTEELPEEWFRTARPAAEVVPGIVADLIRRRGSQKAPLKVPVAIRLDADVVETFKRGGPGWQIRINEASRKAAG